MNKPIIFLIDEDDDSCPSFRANLKRKGYQISLAVDEEDALDRVHKGCFTADSQHDYRQDKHNHRPQRHLPESSQALPIKNLHKL
jgi:DNA-binding NtrC family response regulator